MTTANQIADQLSKAPEHIGDLIIWSISVAHPGVKRDDLKGLLQQVGLDVSLLPDEVPAATIATRAVNKACAEHKASKSILCNEPGVKAWAIVDLSVDDSAAIGDHVGELKNRAMFDKIKEELVFEHDSPLAQRALEIFALADYLTGDDVRAIVKGYLHACNAYRMTGAGGDYYTRREHAVEVRALRDAINAIGDSVAVVLPLPKTEDTTSGISIAARLQVSREVAAIKERVDAWASGESYRHSTIEKRLEDFRHLKDELELMQELLGVNLDDLTEQIETLRTTCNRILGLPSEQAPGSDQVPDPPAKPSTPDADEDPANAAFSRFTIDQLRKMARAKNIDSKGLRKSELISALEAVIN
jgi:hypothetical protein